MRIKMLRVRQKLSTRDMAEKLAMPLAVYTKMENGYIDLTLSCLNAISTILDMEATQLFSGLNRDQIGQMTFQIKLLQERDREIAALKDKISILHAELDGSVQRKVC